jgi:hypothetical protein
VCFANDDCEDGLCVNSQCQSRCDADDECREGEACLLGLCRANEAGRWECIGAGDCPAGDDCVGGSCLRRCLADVHCLECDDGPICTLGYCGP